MRRENPVWWSHREISGGKRRSCEFWYELGVTIQKWQHLFFYIDISASDAKDYSLDA